MTTEQTALQRLKEVCEKATPVSWDTIPYIKTARTALPALIELCEAQAWEMECYELHAFGRYGIHYKTPEADAELTASCTAATKAVEAAKARLEEVCPKK